ncbi:MAG: YbhB/YbcL family Raf kinase inhibitor-like protein [Candidatus Omnitrophica bacterium]|nr:YbhB/YbcL family Raf kinase inhibitor-like protein [Candidatus Omnitrophota bacterium]
MKKMIFFFFLALFAAAGAIEAGETGGGTMKLSSPEFDNNAFIPSKFTCQGQDINPELLIEGIPEAAKRLALIIDDPDAPLGTWVHWVVYNIPVTAQIKEDSVPGEQAITDFKTKGYRGPCPPSGIHRYFFKIYALDTELELGQGAGKKELEKAMEGHILDNAELIGLYRRL